MSELTEKNATNSNKASPISSSFAKRIVDFSFIEKLIECPLCLEQYDGFKFIPRILPCSHTYCQICLNQLVCITDENDLEIDISQEIDQIKLTCPQCLSDHIVNGKKCIEEAFPRNLALQQMLDIKPHFDISCESCKSDFAIANCIHCDLFVCLECKNKHKFEFIEELNDSTKNLSRISSEYICDFKNKIKDFLLSSSNAKVFLSSIINEIIDALKARETILLSEIDNLVNQKIEWFNKIQDGFIRENDKIQTFLHESCSKSSIYTASDEELTNVNRACKQYQSDLNLFISTNSEFSEKEQIKIELEFSNSLIQSIKNEITKIGNVSLKENMLECEAKLNEQSFESIESIGNKFWCPSGVKFNCLTNEIFVADTYNRQIKILDSLNGELLRCHELSYFDKLTLKETQITPRDLHFNSSGLLVVSDSSNHKCHFLDSVNLQVINSFGEKGHEQGQFMNPRGVCIDQFNRIYVCDRGNHRIQAFDVNGKFLNEWGTHGSQPGQFSCPDFLCITSKNHLIVSDSYNHRIQIFDVSSSNSKDLGSFINSFGTYGNKLGSFRFPKGVTTDDEGYIMVADWKNSRLQLFDPDGNFVTVICSKNNNLSKAIEVDRPVGICSISNGGIAYSNWGRSQKIEIL